jgi:integrase
MPARRKTNERGIFEKPVESGKWWVRYRDEFGVEKREYAGTSKKVAHDLYVKRKAEAQHRKLFPPPPPDPRTTVNALIDDVLARMKGQLRSYREYERAGDIWKAEFGDKLLREVTPGDIERWRARQTVSVASINRHLAFLKRAFNLAIADGLTGVNPVRAVKFEKENNARTRFLSRDEEKKLRAVLDPVDWLAVALALATGMRESEQFLMKWEHVDEPNAVLVIPRSKHGERRTIHLSPNGLSILAELRQRAGKSEWVFPSETGVTPVHMSNWMGRVWRPALEEAGITNFKWHDLRHTFASRLVMSGVDMRTVQEALGHKNMTMTQRYAHLAPNHVRDAMSRLDEFAHAG